MSARRFTRRDFIRYTGLGIAAGLAGCAKEAATPTPTRVPATATAVLPTPTPIPPTATAAVTGPKPGGTLTATSAGEMRFDPYWGLQPNVFSYEIFDRLFDYGGPEMYAPYPLLAESWEEEQKLLTVKLWEGVKFQNGRELVSLDIVDNIDRALDESIGHYLYSSFSASVEGAETVDKYTAKIYYKVTYPFKLDDLTRMPLIPKENMADVDINPTGCGPFKFVNYAHGDKLELVRFEDYWQKGKPYIDKSHVDDGVA